MTIDPDVLLNTTYPAPRQFEMALASWQAVDYYNCMPYPTHAFGPKQWALDKGPFPTPLPYAQLLVDECAEFVFRNGVPVFSVPGDDKADPFLKQVIKSNRLNELWIPLAIDNGNQGAIAAKFSVDRSNTEMPVRITFLDIPQECRVWIDPHDRTRILMARIQYPYRDLSDGKWYFYREEWTAQSYVTYRPREAGAASIMNPAMLQGYPRTAGLGDDDKWEIEAHEANEFGLIPITVLRNRAVKGNPLGEGDAWRAFRIMDRIALTLHGEDRSNQLHSEPTTVYKNADVQNDGPLEPGENMFVSNEDPTKEADVFLLEPSGKARAFSHMSIDKWEELLYKQIGLSRVDSAAVANKGNLTALAFSMIYARTIGTCDRKRELWGNSGMVPFFRNMMVALERIGGFKDVTAITVESDITCTWPTYFDDTDQDLATMTTRTNDQVAGGLLPRDRGATRLASAEGIPPHEHPALLAELAAGDAAKAAVLKAGAQTAGGGDGATGGGGDNGKGGGVAPGNLTELANLAAASGGSNFTG